MAVKKLIVGNWKMNLDAVGARDLATRLSEMTDDSLREVAEVVVCPTFVHLPMVSQVLLASTIKLGAQNCAPRGLSALTGEVASQQLEEFGCAYVLLGHSERRALLGESSATVAEKVRHIQDHTRLTPVVCVGESLDVREQGGEKAFVKAQLMDSLPEGVDHTRLVVAYEPFWAIGTGKTASLDDIAAMHGFLADLLPEVTLLYGGSVKVDNAADILKTNHVDGVLVGGASLDADAFERIIRAA
ncbi:MAG: triose-phosphate isomerase [Holosporales bacterium]